MIAPGTFVLLGDSGMVGLVVSAGPVPRCGVVVRAVRGRDMRLMLLVFDDWDHVERRLRRLR